MFQIKWVSQDDVGVYECQVSTSTGIISRQVTLNVVTPEAFIQGGAEYHVDQGSMISLTCVIGSSNLRKNYLVYKVYYNSHSKSNNSKTGFMIYDFLFGDSFKLRTGPLNQYKITTVQHIKSI